ncbi:Kunitz-type U1-aranetoxin-Av1a [Araneus ventricosus]|uniref:Kunitz-type U1-aranetoxin-Av1a n=1 Tax=Araneus ventricosus TaxID=182803 RepID=A0A4Y2AEB9_ARAVE|nr:Kunitz-type U1-aranetoxin-Av1a [Araneus ventricosus]
MAKLLCTLFLAGFVFQANAFSVSTDPPNPSHSENVFNWIPSIFNPVNWVKKIVDINNPFTYIPDFLNPFHYFPKLNPINWIPGWIPGLGKGRCTLPADKGPCDAILTRYYYDKDTKACVEFLYGGCKGNRNNFKQKDECEKACMGH